MPAAKAVADVRGPLAPKMILHGAVELLDGVLFSRFCCVRPPGKAPMKIIQKSIVSAFAKVPGPEGTGQNGQSAPGTKWRDTMAITHLLTTDSTPGAVSRSMNAVADVLERTPCFQDFAELDAFRHQEDCDQANWLLDILYDYCDLHRIWVE
jgi:hypothetical protein